MSAKVGFTSAGHLGHTLNGIDKVQNPSTTTPCASTPYITNTDSHRQSHTPSKLPSFRFADRKTSGSSTDANDDDSIDASAQNNSSINTASAPSTSAALSHPSLAHHAPPSPVSPNPAPGVTLVSSPTQLPSADTGPVPGPFADPSTGLSTGPGPVASVTGPLEAPDVVPALTLPATAQNLAYPTTHHHVEKQSASASAPASTSASSPVAATSTPTAAIAAIASPPLLQPRSRASSCQPESPVAVAEPTTQARRPASLPYASPGQDVADLESPHSASAVVRSRSRRSLSSRRSNGAATSSCPPPTLNTERLQAVEAAQATHSSFERSSKDSSPPGQRELLLTRTLSNSSPPDDRRASVSHRPPVSYRPPANHNAQPSTSTPVRVPPIRAFRSSGSRKSLTLDMPSRPRNYDFGDDPLDSSYDRTLRALEGRADRDFPPSATSGSGRRDTLDGDDTGDVFLKIAREESSRRLPDENLPDETQSVVSRVTRSHRRPLSNVVPTYKPTSPPQIRRRLSDQQETSRQRHYDDDRVSEVSRMSTYRTFAREKAASAHPGEDSSRMRSGGSTVRGPPVTPRSMAFQESDNSAHSHRRSSITENNSTAQARGPTFRTPTGHSHSKAYNSSPLVRSFDFPPQQQQQQQQQQLPAPEPSQGNLEGTESTTSTNAPSTVWDELDDLKSRIHRLELTGKLPSTSGAAVSRLSDERPPTATTTMTTISSSPKRPGNDNQVTDTVSITSIQREAHPLLHAALTKSKHLLDAEVYRALESAANDAMALSTMMGSPGQLGPISSGASTIGSGTTVTDRQLRRKADSVCRSLTELCVALGEDRTQPRTQQAVQAPAPVPAPAPAPSETPTTPTLNKTFAGLASQRRPSISAEQNLARSNTSPRTMSKFEERRLNLLNGNTVPAPRTTTSTPSTPLEPISQRRSSLLVARTRRAGTEEPEDGRRSTILLRTRRAGTEEPDEGRRTSLLVRNRRGTVGEDDEDRTIFRSPSRAHTDLNTMRSVAHEQTSQPQASENNTLASSALPRRRFASSNLNPSRLATPLTSNVPSPRRYLERSGQDREGSNGTERITEERGQRHMSLGQSMLGRTSSMIRRPNRDSTVTITQSSAAAGGYR
ncbi:hypothetical protein G7Z17_g4926 [Cylindrodendrum hubeiense]|uniref:LPXTG-motif cell wall anchor domain protein n=1 Tax=Cylindrodendrum hubeiense TaxID=595255 RepID=A0A9P5LGP7_9HYPO|nr:hypothetical protein G7Z17_g4926 [Cylindrodendrum hubeiense]